MASSIQEVSLHIDGKVFKVKKDVLCEHSDYFRAMFSGNYIEDEKQDITIDVVDANSMDVIIRYMDIGLIDLSEFTIPVIGTLAISANFLQITELTKQIQYCLDLQLSISNWVEIMTIAGNAGYVELEQLAASYGLLNFKEMKPQYIPTFKKLFWYLYNPNLNVDTEVDVFKFGLEWVLHSETCGCADILLMILGCLDVNKVTNQDVKEISILIKDFENSLAPKVVDCLKLLFDNKLQVHLSVVVWYKKKLCETFGESVYNEVYNIIKETTSRWLVFTPIVPIWRINDGKLEVAPHYMYTFTAEKAFQKWLEVADKNLWGWSVTSWGPNRLVVVGGEHGRGTGQFMKDVRVYDTLRKQWTRHGVELLSRRHAGVTVCGDSLFIIGGVGGFRVTTQAAVIYDLKQRTHRKIANFPDAVQSPAICTHYDTVFAAGQKDIYKYEDLGEVDQWINVVSTQIRPNRLVSFGEYIYCTQSYFSQMYRFRPGIDTKLQLVTQFAAPPAAFANLGNRLIVFTKTMTGQQTEQLRVEEYTGPCNCEEELCMPGHEGCGPEVIYGHKTPDFTVNDVSGACSLVLEIPSIHYETPDYYQKLISRYGNITYETFTD